MKLNVLLYYHSVYAVIMYIKFSFNKMVEGVYRLGYYENLGNVILKRILLLVLVLDKAKCQSYLPREYGIDGFVGGSPLLFKPESWIKSSSQLIHGRSSFMLESYFLLIFLQQQLLRCLI
ncbi:abnormal spindle microcephaly-associated protein-like isoform X1 [Spatholobus suberectus]|nr:abnormal spindle microcephaly-associated protein-like isoform X1 [Spatholobus suberectus]